MRFDLAARDDMNLRHLALQLFDAECPLTRASRVADRVFGVTDIVMPRRSRAHPFRRRPHVPNASSVSAWRKP